MTVLARASSIRIPKLLHPSPATDTSSDPTLRISVIVDPIPAFVAVRVPRYRHRASERSGVVLGERDDGAKRAMVLVRSGVVLGERDDGAKRAMVLERSGVVLGERDDGAKRAMVSERSGVVLGERDDGAKRAMVLVRWTKCREMARPVGSEHPIGSGS